MFTIDSNVEDIFDPTLIDDDYILNKISPLTDIQEKILSILQLLSAILSIIGSTMIVQKIIRNRKRTTSYDRILLGLSTTDIISSLTQGLSPFWLPQQTSQRSAHEAWLHRNRKEQPHNRNP